MSIESWHDEYYPTSAEHCPKEEALAHSTRKWEGFRADVLERHAVQFEDEIWLTEKAADEDGHRRHSAMAGTGSCALCRHYMWANGWLSCVGCPLYEYRGGVVCYKALPGEDESPYDVFCHTGNPEPMIELLHRAAAMIAEEQG